MRRPQNVFRFGAGVCLASVLALSACNGKSDPATDTGEPDAPTTTSLQPPPADDPVVDPAGVTDDPRPTGSAEGEVALPTLAELTEVRPQCGTEVSPQREVAFLGVRLPNSDAAKVSFKMADGIQEFSPSLYGSLSREAQREFEDFVDNSEADAARAGEDFFPYSYTVEWRISAISGNVISLEEDYWADTGGAHGIGGTDTRLYDRGIADFFDTAALFSNAEAADKAIADMARERLIEVRRARVGKEFDEELLTAGVDEALAGGVLAVFPVGLTGNPEGGAFTGFRVHFPPYSVGSYAEGTYSVDIPADALIDLVISECQPLFKG